MGVVDLRPSGDGVSAGGAAEWATYSPSESFDCERRRKDEDAAIADLQQTFDAWYRQEVEDARQSPPPVTVEAYRVIYGHFPTGWPP